MNIATDSEAQYERMKGKVHDELKKHFRPEFLNRIDEIVVFKQLNQDEIVKMVDLLISRVDKNLAAQDMGIELTENAKNLLAVRGFDPVLGARPLRRTIQREIEDILSEKILFREVHLHPAPAPAAGRGLRRGAGGRGPRHRARAHPAGVRGLRVPG